MITKTAIIRAVKQLIQEYAARTHNASVASCALCHLVPRNKYHEHQCDKCINHAFFTPGYTFSCLNRTDTHNNFCLLYQQNLHQQYWEKALPVLQKYPAAAFKNGNYPPELFVDLKEIAKPIYNRTFEPNEIV